MTVAEYTPNFDQSVIPAYRRPVSMPERTEICQGESPLPVLVVAAAALALAYIVTP